MAGLRPLIGISSCLAGEAVRYDGTDKLDSDLLESLQRYADVQAICPEAGAGLGIPRPPIQWTEVGGVFRLCGVEDSSRDVTDALQFFSGAQLPLLERLDGYVFKARSPSCGLHAVLRVHADGREDLLGRGYFANFVHEQVPQLPLADEEQLADAQQLKQFEQAVQAFFLQRVHGEGNEYAT